MPRTTRRILRLSVLITALALALALPATGAEKEPFTAHDLVSMNRVSGPQVSPDGNSVAFVLRTTDLDANRGRTDLWHLDLETHATRPLTTHPAADFNPLWAADGSGLFFLSTRSGSSQVWWLPMAGGEARQVTDLPLSAGNLVLSPKGNRIAVSLEVFPDCEDLKCTTDRLAEREANPATGRVYDQLFMRHWDTWKDGRRSHLFVLDLNDEHKAENPRDVTAGMDADVPSKPFGGPEEIAFTPDGEGLVFSARVAGAEEPWSTNFDLYHAPASGDKAPRQVTDNPAWDTAPVFSPDGSTLAYLAMEHPGYESDRLRIVTRSWKADGTVGPAKELTKKWDLSAGGILFAADGKTLYTTAGDVGEVALFAIDAKSGKVERLIGGGHVRSPGIAGDRLIFGRDDLKNPVDLYSTDLSGGDLKRLTEVNAEALERIAFGDYEQFSFPGWNDETVYGYVVKPANFDPAKKYPLAFLIHGGPQGSFDNDFHYRWNPQSYAGAGYAAVMIDFHGSSGYGQDFKDSIRGDWGGKPLEDLQKGLAAALERYPWIDGDRACALGASYGGYMINWIAGNWSDGFQCLVNHDGLFDTRSMYYSTEELWFPETDFEGTPWTNPEGYARHNPALHVAKWQTPMLVIHGALDYRVVETQGFAAFTAAKRRGIDARFLYFPDENHWVLKPQNSLQWHDEVLRWLGQYTAP